MPSLNATRAVRWPLGIVVAITTAIGVMMAAALNKIILVLVPVTYTLNPPLIMILAQIILNTCTSHV